MENELLKAYAEIDYILSIIPKTYILKVPLKLREKFNREKDEEYIVNIDRNKKLNEQNLLKKTKTILAVLKYNYWCESDEEKEKLYTRFKENEIKYQNEIREKYNPDNIFKKNNIDTGIVNQELPCIIKEENIFKRIFNFIKRIIKKKRD